MIFKYKKQIVTKKQLYNKNMFSTQIKPDLKRILILILLPLCLFVSLGGCISNSTTNPSTEDPVVPDPDAKPDEADDPPPAPEETFGPTTGLKMISAGGQHNCSIKNVDGSLWCWGNNENGQLGNSTTTTASSPRSISSESWQTVVTGDEHSCGIDENSALYCWGKNDAGQVGNGTTITQEEPVAISTNADWRDISLGTNHSCAIKDDNTLWCWGSNTSLQLGHSTTNNRRPSLLSKTNADESIVTEKWRVTTSGNSHTCAIKNTDSSLWCWGGNGNGQLGQGTTSALIAEPTALAVGSRWLSIAASGNHSCAIRENDNSLWCWGGNEAGQVGNGSNEDVTTPTLISSTTAWNAIGLGTDHSCGIKKDNSLLTLWCWGGNSESQLGDGTTAPSNIPKQIGAASDWDKISLGKEFSCGIDANSKLYCWGNNSVNQLGYNSTNPVIDTSQPQQVGTDTDWSNISSGDSHSCAIKDDESLWCWGRSSFGQAAQIAEANTKTPTQESSAGSWLNVAAAGNHSCAIKTDNSLWCWGLNNQGQLGNNTNLLKTAPTPVVGDSSWTELSLGVDHSCAIRDDGSLWCWGDNSQAQLGDGGIVATNTIPKQVETATSWSNISLGNQFSCGIQTVTDTDTNVTTQELFCWGRDLSKLNVIPPPDPADITTPLLIGTDVDWTTISAGDNHACATKNTNHLYCWGDNSYGQLGQGDTTFIPTPFPVGTDINWLSVSAGGNHTCANQKILVPASDPAEYTYPLYCWGNNDAGQLGIGNTSHQPTPRQVTHNDELGWHFISSGKDHTCAIDSDFIGHCWGLNEFGQLGNGIALDTDTAKRFDLSENWGSVDDDTGDLKMGSIDSGTLHSCGLKTDPFDTTIKTLWCGGINNFGQLGIGSTANQSAPVQLKGPNTTLEDWQYVSTGHFHSCAITNAGALYCWGRNSHGQLATGNTANNASNWSLLSPITEGLDDWQMVDAGASHTCGIKNTDELWCWGDNATGQLGNNSTIDSDTPIMVMNQVDDVAVGGYTEETGHTAGGHTCAIKTDGTLWCWGENDTSQLGDQPIPDPLHIDYPRENDVHLPKQIIVDAAAEGFPPQFNNSWVSIKAGNRFTCGLQTDQQLYCWGDHTFGQTGIGIIEPSSNDIPVPVTSVISPRPIDGNHDVLDYAVGQNFACAIDSANDLWCWGYKGSSQAALDADTAKLIALIPARHPLKNEWQGLSLGMNHGCGIRQDDDLKRNVFCWGDGAEFQFGNGSGWKETPQRLSLQ